MLYVAMSVSFLFYVICLWRHRNQCFAILPLNLMQLEKTAVSKLDLLRRGLSWFHFVFGHGFKLGHNIPLKCIKELI